MKTFDQWQRQIHESGRLMSEVTISEAHQIIDCIALEWMQGKAKTLAYPAALQSIGYSLETAKERKKNYRTIFAELGAIGGSKTSAAKQKSSRENGKKGGRPKNKIAHYRDYMAANTR